MKLSWFLHPGRWLPDLGRLRRPRGSRSAGSRSSAQALAELEAQVAVDQATLRLVADGLDRLETRLDETAVIRAARERGYFTPEEDDRVRQALLMYRNHRLALYDILFRHEPYRRVASPRLRLRVFTLVYAAALQLYSRSLKLIQVAEHEPLFRAKLNEPDAKFGLDAGFFDDVMAGYSRLRHYSRLAAADWYWVRCRGLIRRLGLGEEAGVEWCCEQIRDLRRIVRHRLANVLRVRLRRDWRHSLVGCFRPARRTSYGLRSLVGGRFAGLWLHPESEPVLNEAVLTRLQDRLQPGDILLVRAEGKLTASLLPGFWAHAAIYVGQRSALRELPVDGCPCLRECLGRMPAADRFGAVLEAVSPRVRLASLPECLEGDHVLALRPRLDPARRAAALNEAFGHLDKAYDFDFDFNASSRVVCTELVYRTFHGRAGLTFPLTKRLGRYTLTGDDLVNAALDSLAEDQAEGQAPLSVVALVLRRRDGKAHFIDPERAPTVLRRIRAGWRPFRRDRVRGSRRD